MDYSRPMTIELSGQEVAAVITALNELPAKFSHDLLKRFEALDAAATEQENKVPGPDLKMVSQA